MLGFPLLGAPGAGAPGLLYHLGGCRCPDPGSRGTGPFPSLHPAVPGPVTQCHRIDIHDPADLLCRRLPERTQKKPPVKTISPTRRTHDDENRNVGQVTLYHYNYGVRTAMCFATQQLVRERNFSCVLLRQAEGNILLRRSSYLVRAAAKMAAHPSHAGEFLGMMQARRRSSLGGLGEEDLQGIQQFLCQEISSRPLPTARCSAAPAAENMLPFSPAATKCGTEAGFCAMMCFFSNSRPRKKRIAWAPSFGTGQVATYNRRRFARDIGAYRYLSAREASGVQIIRQLTGREAVQITDPVLQLPAQRWRDLYRHRKPAAYARPYIFCYFLNEPNGEALRCLEAWAAGGLTVLAFASRYACLESGRGSCLWEEAPGTFWRFWTAPRQFCQTPSMLWHSPCSSTRKYIFFTAAICMPPISRSGSSPCWIGCTFRIVSSRQAAAQSRCALPLLLILSMRRCSRIGQLQARFCRRRWRGVANDKNRISRYAAVRRLQSL